jgi:phage terminase small subunit
MRPLSKLTPRQRLFVEVYDGNEENSARLAGFSGAPNYLKKKGEELISDPLIVEAIRERSKYMADTKKAIADREERQQLWTSILRNEDPHRKEEVDENGAPVPEGNIPLPIRLKASELLGKSEADFVEKIDMTSHVTLSDIVLGAYKTSDKSLEDIEAEYKILREQQKAQELVTDNTGSDKPEPTIETIEDLI